MGSQRNCTWILGLAGFRVVTTESDGEAVDSRVTIRIERRGSQSYRMPSYRGYRFSPEIISHAVWLYHRFALSFRDVEDLLARRGVEVTYEAIRKWCRRFGPEYAGRLRRRRGRLGDTWHLDEVFVTIQGRQQYLWRAVDEDGDVLDILVQPRRNRHAAVRFFRKLLKTQRHVPRRYCQVDEKLVDRPPRYWARASREPAMLGIKNGRRPQLDCEHHSAACRDRSVTLVGAGGWWPDPQLD